MILSDFEKWVRLNIFQHSLVYGVQTEFMFIDTKTVAQIQQKNKK